MADDSATLQPGERENWGSKFGVILAVAGSAVGLGNFLRFPGTAVNNGGGAFMIPYIISFLLLGVPIVWCEWTLGRLGGRYGINNGAGIFYALWRTAPAKGLGALTILVPVGVYMYYVLLEALCLNYAVDFFAGGLSHRFAAAIQNLSPEAQKQGIVAASGEYFAHYFGLTENASLFSTKMLWMVLICFLVNFIIIYRGVAKGIESFCKVAMPLLVLCACIILVRVLTLPNISVGLGFMWNPDWARLWDPEVWLQAAGQIFFSLSVGFGLILCYASYLRANDDVVLTSLSASSANEFCEVVLGGLIVVPTAFLFFGADAAKGGTFAIGFQTVPAIMHYMPGGRWFGGLWFGLLFLAGVTSSLSMLQPAIAFLEDGFALGRRASVLFLAVFTTAGAVLVMYFSKGAVALDFTDFACNFLMIVAGLIQVLMFGWVIGAERGVREANRGADFPIPRFMPFVIRYLTPGFLIVVLSMWCYYNAPGYMQRMSPSFMNIKTALIAQFPNDYPAADKDKTVHARLVRRIHELQSTPTVHQPDWLTAPPPGVAKKMDEARAEASVARFSIVGVFVLLVIIIAAVDVACRNRMGRIIADADARGVGLEA